MASVPQQSQETDSPEPGAGAQAQGKSSTKSDFPRRTQSLYGFQVLGTGSYLPETIVTNADLQQRIPECDPAWIEKRTGILERRVVKPGESTIDLAEQAAKAALENAGLRGNDIDLLVVGTFTPDYQCPSTACLLQDRLGIDAPAFDVAAACAGFMYSLVTAAQYVVTGNAKAALVVGADCNSRIVNQKDRSIAPLFGDGAGAVVLVRGNERQGLIAYQLGADGSGGELLDRPSGGTRNPLDAESLLSGEQYLRMDGKAVFKWAVRAVAETIQIVLEAADLTANDVKLFLLHQANMRIIQAACNQYGLPAEKVLNNLPRCGNTSAGSIPLILDEAAKTGRLERDDVLLMTGFGAGLTWGTGLLRW